MASRSPSRSPRSRACASPGPRLPRRRASCPPATTRTRRSASTGMTTGRTPPLVREKTWRRSVADPVILVETNGAEPQTTTVLRGIEPVVISIDWDEVARGDNPTYIEDILVEIAALDLDDVRPPMHVGMPEVVRQLEERLMELKRG